MTVVMTPEGLAARWSIPKSHVYRLTREGRIPVVKLGRYYRYRLDQIEQFEVGNERCTLNPPKEWPRALQTPGPWHQKRGSDAEQA